MADDNGNAPAYNIAGTRPPNTSCVFPTILERLRAMDCGHTDCKDPAHRAGATFVTITVWDVQKWAVDSDTGNVIPTMRARQVELPVPDDRQKLLSMLDQAQSHRTGELTLAAAAHDEPED
jgi:hypothetical protein